MLHVCRRQICTTLIATPLFNAFKIDSVLNEERNAPSDDKMILPCLLPIYQLDFSMVEEYLYLEFNFTPLSTGSQLIRDGRNIRHVGRDSLVLVTHGSLEERKKNPRGHNAEVWCLI